MTHGGGHDVAEVDVGDFGDWDVGFGQGGFDGGCPELGGRDGGEGAVELSEWIS